MNLATQKIKNRIELTDIGCPLMRMKLLSKLGSDIDAQFNFCHFILRVPNQVPYTYDENY